MAKEHKKHDKDKHVRQNKYESDIIKKCNFCNSTHLRGNCPAYGKKCRSCKRKTHFEICCPHKEVKAVAEKFDDSYSEVSQSSDSCDNEFFIDSINEESSSNSASSNNISSVDDGKSDWSVALEMNGNDTTFKIDTGAQYNVISKNLLKSLSPCPKLKPATV